MNNTVNQSNVRFIKLGFGGGWTQSCFDENVIRLGYESELHEQCLKKDWDAVRQAWRKHRNDNSGAASRDLNQIRDFYEQPDSTIWITFHNGMMYWCRAKQELQVREDGTRTREVIGRWSCEDQKGNRLFMRNLDGRVTKTQMFRGTICSVAEPDYVIRKIEGVENPLVTDVKSIRQEMVLKIEGLLKGLSWQDFELLVDLIFMRAGWNRQSVLGGTTKDIDIDAMNALGDRNAFIQIKSQTNVSVIKEYIAKFDEYFQYEEMYFVYHSLSGKREEIDSLVESRVVDNSRRVSIWGCAEVSELVVKLGLLDWLIARRS